MKKYDFVSVDFENADYDQFACQIGIVAVENGQICEEIEYLIQPPGNRYGKTQSNIHGIKPEHTKNSETFDILWPDIERYFSGQTVLFHNGGTDNAILYKTLSYYMLMMPIFEIIDTTVIIANKKLHILAEAYDVEINHHNALSDARATANILLKHTAGFRPEVWPEDKEIKKGMFKNKRIEKDLLLPDLNCENKENPLFDRKVVITGEFFLPRNELAKRLKSMGADINTAISKKTNFVIVGTNPGESKMKNVDELRFQGFNIKTINELELIEILDGNADKYHVEKEVIKKLKITYPHFEKSVFKIDNIHKLDIFSSKEFHICGDFGGDKNLLYQMVGFLGALTNEELDSTIDVILLGDETIGNLKNGIIDEVLKSIEDKYNKSKSINFKFVFLSEFEFISYYKNRVETKYADDSVVTDVFERYFHTYQDYSLIQRSRLIFDDDKNNTKIDGKYVFRLEDGRSWCPSRQIR